MSVTPESILAQLAHPEGWVGWIPTVSGGFRPFEPKVEDVRVRDIFCGLAGTWRYGGNTKPRVTVAEHVILVSEIIEALWGRDLAPAGLLHDACEAYTHDLQKPLRQHVEVVLPSGERISWEEFDRRVNLIIFEALGVDPALLDHPQVQAADILGAVFEKRDMLSLPTDADWGLPEIPKIISGWTLRNYAPTEAEAALTARWVELGLPYP